MRKNEKEAFFDRQLVGEIVRYTLGAIAALTMIQPITISNTVLANPARENAIALKIDNLKQSDKRWIEIDLSEQHLFAWNGKNQTFSTVISTGRIKTPTYPGVYTIQRKYPLDRMRGADYDISNVPSVLYYDRGFALHGAYWHNNFGTPMSHGCVNLPVNNAKWLFDWAKIGTPVIIHQ